MTSQQILNTNLLKERHDKMLNDLFNFTIKDIYEKLLQNETSDNDSVRSTLYVYDLQVVKNYPQENVQNSISINHYTYYHLNLTHSNFKNCNGLNILNIVKHISKQPSQITTPFVLLKLDKSFLLKYLGDDIKIDNLYDTMQLNIDDDDNHKIKVCKYKNENNYYIVMFFDSLNYNSSHSFVNHNIIENLNLYHNENLNLYYDLTNNILSNNSPDENKCKRTSIFNPSIQMIEQKYVGEFEKILDSSNRTEKISENIHNLVLDIINTREERERNFLLDIENVVERTIANGFKKSRP